MRISGKVLTSATRYAASHQESFIVNSEKLKQTLKETIDLITELTVRFKNEMLKKYDESLSNYKQIMDQGVKSIKLANEFNINQVVEGLLSQIRKGNEGVACLDSGAHIPHVQSVQQKAGNQHEHRQSEDLPEVHGHQVQPQLRFVRSSLGVQ
jgi:hypothetical protein